MQEKVRCLCVQVVCILLPSKCRDCKDAWHCEVIFMETGIVLTLAYIDVYPNLQP